MSCSQLIRIGITLVTVTALAGEAAAQEVHLTPTCSLVDYLKSQKQASEFADRRVLFRQHVSATQSYTGTKKQNIALLAALVRADKRAARAAEASKAALENDLRKSPPVEGPLSFEYTKACPSYVPAAGFGVHGTYSFQVQATVYKSQIRDRAFAVAVNSAAASHGALHVSGTVRIFKPGQEAPVQEFVLEPAWFKTIRSAGSRTVHVYAPKGTVIEVPAGGIEAEVKLHPVIHTSTGVVPLWACQTRVKIEL